MNTDSLLVGTKVIRAFITGNKRGEIIGITSKEKRVERVGFVMQIVYRIRFQDGFIAEYEKGDFGVID